MKGQKLERILGRLEDLDSVNLTNLVQRLAHERKLLETVLNTVKDGVLVIDAEGTIEYSNNAAHGLIGLKEESEATLWKHAPGLRESIDVEGLNHLGEGTLITREFELMYPERRIIRFYLSRMSDDQSDKDRYVIVLNDVTEDRLSTKEKLENERISSIFMLAAGVAHELGNPLNSINIHLQLVERELSKFRNKIDGSKIVDSITVCHNEVKRLDGIIHNFLNAIRPRMPELYDLSILEVLDEVLGFLAQELEDLAIKVEIQLNNEIPTIKGDRNLIKQALFNVIKNAMEAMDNGGELRISTQTNDEFLTLKIKDTGVGIESDKIGGIFDAFTSTKDSGHGLGMMVVQRIMRDHGGQVGVDSQAGEGTTISLSFPLSSRRIRMLEARSDES